jgi:hypothetical protein
MLSNISNSFKLILAKNFIETVDNNNYYLQFCNENNEPIFAKKILSENIKLGIKRNKIGTGGADFFTEYSKFKPEIYNKNYYGISEGLHGDNVYKLIEKPANQSTSLPNSTDLKEFKTVDGYVWKFMYNIPTKIAYKFSTDTHIPVIQTDSRYYNKDKKEYEINYDDPPNGHGYNTEYELNANCLIIAIKLDAKIFKTEFKYKKINLIRNPGVTENKDIIFSCFRIKQTDVNYKQLNFNIGDSITIMDNFGNKLTTSIIEKLTNDEYAIHNVDDLIYFAENFATSCSLINPITNENLGKIAIIKPEYSSFDSISYDDRKIKNLENKITLTLHTIIEL